jgi:hypothetical protein
MVNLEKFDYAEPQFNWDLSSCEYDDDNMAEDFRNRLEESTGGLLRQRGLVWKANAREVIIRRKSMRDDDDFVNFDENAEPE